MAKASTSWVVENVKGETLTAASGGDVKAAVARLGSELLAFLREHAPEVHDQPEISR